MLDSMTTTRSDYKTTFNATGGELFILMLKNGILTILTLGLYYPWAKADFMRFFYSNDWF